MPPEQVQSSGTNDEELGKAVAARRALIAKRQREIAVGTLDPNFQAAQTTENTIANERFGVGTGVAGTETNFRGVTAGDVGGTAGAIAGGMAGARLGAAAGFPGTGAVVGSLMGAVGGGGAGEAARQQLSNEPFNTTPIIRESIRQGSYDLLGLGVNAALRGTARIFAGKPIVAAVAANERLTTLAKQVQGDLLAAGHSPEMVKQTVDSFAMLSQKVDGRLLRFTEEAAGSSMFAKDIPARRAAQDDAANLIVSHIEKQVGPFYTKAQTARKVMDKWNGILADRKTQLGGIYDDIATRLKTDATQGPSGVTKRIVTETGSDIGMVDLRPVGKSIADTKKIIAELKENGMSIPQIEMVSDLVDSMPPGKVSFALAQRLRGHIAELEDNLVMNQVASGGGFGAALKKPKAVRDFERVRSAFTEQMEKAITEFDAALPAGKTKVLPLWKQADAAWGDMQNLYNNAEVRGWMRAAEEKLAGPSLMDEMLQPQNEERMKMVVRGLQNTPELPMLRRWHLESLKEKATVDGVFDPKKYLKILGTETSGFGAETARVLHGPAHIQTIQQIARDMQVVRAEKPGKSFAMTLAEVGPAIAIFTGTGAGLFAGNMTGALGGAAGTLATIGLTVKGFNKLLTSPRLARDVLTLSTMRPRSGKAIAATARVLSALSSDDIRTAERGKRVTLESLRERNANQTFIRQELGEAP